MGVVISQAIYVDVFRPKTRPAPAHGARTAPERSGAAQAVARKFESGKSGEQTRQLLTTGLFPVTTGVGNPITLSFYLSNGSNSEQEAHVQIRRVVNGRTAPVLSQAFVLAPGTGHKIDLGNLAGETVEILVERTSSQLLPSASVTEYFRADAGVVVHLVKSAGDFVETLTGR